jgi:hypothetical protein
MNTHIKIDHRYDLDVHNMTTLVQGEFKRFMGNIIKTNANLEHVTTKVDKYVQQTKDLREVISTHMDQHHFHYMHACEDLFSQWAEYDNVHPFDQSPHA